MKLTCRESERLDWFDSERRDGDLFTWNNNNQLISGLQLCVSCCIDATAVKLSAGFLLSYLDVFIQKQSAHRHLSLFLCRTQSLCSKSWQSGPTSCSKRSLEALQDFAAEWLPPSDLLQKKHYESHARRELGSGQMFDANEKVKLRKGILSEQSGWPVSV